MSQPIRCRGGHLLFQINPKNHKHGTGRWNLASCSVKFRLIPFSGFKGEVENVSANHRPGRPSWFSDRPEKTHTLDWGHGDLASCQVSLNSVQGFERRVENVSANQRPGRSSCFFDRPEKHKLSRWRLDLASCQVTIKLERLVSYKKISRVKSGKDPSDDLRTPASASLYTRGPEVVS